MATQSQYDKSLDLRERFGMSNGGMRCPYRCKNQNIYLVKGRPDQETAVEDQDRSWIAFSDIDEFDVARWQLLLEDGEYIETGWKDMQPYEYWDDIFRDGGGVWVRVTKDKIEWVLHGKMPTGHWS